MDKPNSVAFKLGELTAEVKGLITSIGNLDVKFDGFLVQCKQNRLECKPVIMLPSIENRLGTIEIKAEKIAENAVSKKLSRAEFIKNIMTTATVSSAIIGGVYYAYLFLVEIKH